MDSLKVSMATLHDLDGWIMKRSRTCIQDENNMILFFATL